MHLSFVCCVESGFLEAQTLRMVESLRKFGSTFANAPVIAVTPRRGPPLSKRTLDSFARLDARHIYDARPSRYEWFNFLNKPLALRAAEREVTTPYVCWLDSDILFLGDPDQLNFQPGEDFLGFPVEDKEMGTTGKPDDPYEPLWQDFCQILSIDIESLPWVTTAETNERVRFYLNGGIFAYRKSTQFAEAYLETCLKLLDSPTKTDVVGYNAGVKEMSAIGFVVVKNNLNWRALPYSHDYVISSFTHDLWYKEALLREARIAHYHDAMWPPFWDTLLACLGPTHPNVAQWLSGLGPMRNDAPIHWRVVSKILRKMRKRSELEYNSRAMK